MKPATNAEDIVTAPKMMACLNRFDPMRQPVEFVVELLEALVDLLEALIDLLEALFISPRTASMRLPVSANSFVDPSKRSSIRFPNSSSRSSVQLSLGMVCILPAYRAKCNILSTK